MSTGDFGISSSTPVQLGALVVQSRPGSPVNGSVYSSASEQAAVGRVHNSVDAQLRDVSNVNRHLAVQLFVELADGTCSYSTFQGVQPI